MLRDALLYYKIKNYKLMSSHEATLLIISRPVSEVTKVTHATSQLAILIVYEWTGNKHFVSLRAATCELWRDRP